MENKNLKELYLPLKISGVLGYDLYLLDKENKQINLVVSMLNYKEEFYDINFNNLFYKATDLDNRDCERFITEFIKEAELMKTSGRKEKKTVRNAEEMLVIYDEETRMIPCHEINKCLPYPIFHFELNDYADDYTLVDVYNYRDYVKDFTTGDSIYGQNLYYLECDLTDEEKFIYQDNITTINDCLKENAEYALTKTR